MKFSGLLTFILLFSLSAAGCGRPVNEQDLSSPNPPQKTDLQNRVSEDDDQKQTSNAASEQDDSSVSNEKTGSEPEASESETQSEPGPDLSGDKIASTLSSRSIRLDVPQKVQETSYYCAVACLQMVLEYHDIYREQTDLAKGLKTHPVTGTEYEDLAREASLLIFGKVPENENEPGYRSVLWKRNQGTAEERKLFEKRVQTDLNAKDPVFISVNVAPAYGYEKDGVHELVLYGADYDENSQALRYYCIDPSYLQQDPVYGGKVMWSADELWNIMNDNPEPGYVVSVKRRGL